MRYQIWGLAIIPLILMITIGCSNSQNRTPVAPSGDNSPSSSYSEGDRAIIGSGTFEIDLDNMEITNVVDRAGEFHYNLTGFLGTNFRWFITEVHPPYLFIRLEVENPTSIQVYDVRLIYRDAYGKTVMNPDGYTNFYAPGGGVDWVPFHYFAQDSPNQAFPIGPGAVETRELILEVPAGAPGAVSYVIECSVGANAREPIKISEVSLLGSITPMGGGAIVSCEVDEWQDDISGVFIQANAFHSEEVPMYSYRGTNTYTGSLVNLNGVAPGEHKVWIRAESPNPDNIHLWWPIIVNVPDVVDNAPAFQYLPHPKEDIVSVGYTTFLNGAAIDLEGDSVDYTWMQLSPAAPVGHFLGTVSMSSVRWDPPQVNEDTEYLFMVSAKERNGAKTARAVVALLNEEPLPPMITQNPLIAPNPIMEDSIGQFGVAAKDPNRLEGGRTLKYLWEQISPSSPHGTWLSTDQQGVGQYPSWRSPEVSADTPFTFKIYITKDWTNPPLVTEGFVSFDVIND